MPSRSRPSRTFLTVLVLGVSTFFAGCVHNAKLASPPALAPVQPQAERPMNVAPDTDQLPPHPATPPAPTISDSIEPPRLFADLPAMKMPSAPPKPIEKFAGQHESGAPDNVPAPQVVPQVSPADRQNYERQTSSDMSVAQQNLSQAQARQLNPSQQNMADQVRSFLKQAGDASKAGDWARAQNLANKAKLLSFELLKSL